MKKKPYGGSMTLREYREAKGLTLAEMAAQVGCSASTLSLIERGMRKPKFALTRMIVEITRGRVKARDLHPELTW
jgi:transcriptional regulator with XRE-family HTH domain